MKDRRKLHPFALTHAAALILHRATLLCSVGGNRANIVIRPHNDDPQLWVAELTPHSGVGTCPTTAIIALSEHILEECT